MVQGPGATSHPAQGPSARKTPVGLLRYNDSGESTAVMPKKVQSRNGSNRSAESSEETARLLARISFLEANKSLLEENNSGLKTRVSLLEESNSVLKKTVSQLKEQTSILKKTVGLHEKQLQ